MPLQNYEGVLEDMMKTLHHRGPDGEGRVHIESQVLMGHRRLSVIDLENGKQPMISKDGRYSLIFNGEIYNYLELREELISQGVAFHTISDTEVLLNMLVQYDTDAIGKLNGMFSFVFHDRKENQWISARDPMGIKPLYFCQTDDHLLFASEIKALLAHPQVTVLRNEKALNQYLSFQMCLDEETLFQGVRKVLPGHYLLGQGSEIKKTVTYWDTNYKIDGNHTEQDYLDQIYDTLQDCVRLQLRADVQVGAHLSGGMDSSLVSVLASKQLDSEISLFHGKFAEGPNYDESEYAEIIAEQTQGSLHQTIPTAQEFADILPDLIYALDEPVAGPGLFPQYAVSKLAKEKVKVVLGGQGGDEIFGGYARYLVGYLEQALKGAIHETQEEGEYLVSLESIVPHLPVLKQYVPLLSQFWREGLFGEMDQRYFRLVDKSQGIHELLDKEFLERFDKEYLFSIFQKVFNHPDTLSFINKMTHFDQKTLLPALLQVEDRVSMHVSLESRVPLLDTRLVDLVTTIPPKLKFQGGRTKHLLKLAVKNLLPEKILNRKDKMGFPVPIK
ncbi:MAG: asparagine synthase (glutamine-hydrolyzing), partial [Verrucomicrobiota bacterium]|nr:asparagine synthase (glutamine-hydrolyzing) [Verrucomicrobiota bacterium]